MGFVQFPCAFIAAHFHRLPANFDSDRVRIQLAVASCTGFLKHHVALHVFQWATMHESVAIKIFSDLLECFSTTHRRFPEFRG